MKLIWVSAAVLGLISPACVSQATRRYQANSQSLESEYGSMLFVWDKVCEERIKKGQESEGPFAYGQCVPLLYFEFQSAVNNHINQCLTVEKKKSETCRAESKKYVDQHVAKQRLRYVYANLEEAKLICQAGGECDGGITYELALMESHNKAVLNALSAEMKGAKTQYLSDHQQERKALGGAFQSIGSGLQRQPSTNCTSVPNGMGGFNTQCN